MARLARLVIPGLPHHITLRGESCRSGLEAAETRPKANTSPATNKKTRELGIVSPELVPELPGISSSFHGTSFEDDRDMNHSRRSCVEHQLPEYAQYGHPSSYEYPLPTQLERSSLSTLHPWIARAATLIPADAHNNLEARWKGLHSDALCKVRDYLLKCEVTSVVLAGSRAWLLCVHDNGGFNLVAPPLDRNSIKKQLSQWHVNDYPLLTEFLARFGGLREDFAPGGGCFISDREWECVNEPWMEQVKGYSYWRDSLIIFSSRGGDKLLLHRSGQVGWWVADEMRMRAGYENLETCLADFVRYRETPWPFEPREPRLDFPRIAG
jgi:hypothetical protein